MDCVAGSMHCVTGFVYLLCHRGLCIVLQDVCIASQEIVHCIAGSGALYLIVFVATCVAGDCATPTGRRQTGGENPA